MEDTFPFLEKRMDDVPRRTVRLCRRPLLHPLLPELRLNAQDPLADQRIGQPVDHLKLRRLVIGKYRALLAALLVRVAVGLTAIPRLPVLFLEPIGLVMGQSECSAHFRRTRTNQERCRGISPFQIWTCCIKRDR